MSPCEALNLREEVHIVIRDSLLCDGYRDGMYHSRLVSGVDNVVYWHDLNQ